MRRMQMDISYNPSSPWLGDGVVESRLPRNKVLLLLISCPILVAVSFNFYLYHSSLTPHRFPTIITPVALLRNNSFMDDTPPLNDNDSEPISLSDVCDLFAIGNFGECLAKANSALSGAADTAVPR
jgi:hypothetical protein